jgi:hypothetical protein
LCEGGGGCGCDGGKCHVPRFLCKS